MKKFVLDTRSLFVLNNRNYKSQRPFIDTGLFLIEILSFLPSIGIKTETSKHQASSIPRISIGPSQNSFHYNSSQDFHLIL